MCRYFTTALCSLLFFCNSAVFAQNEQSNPTADSLLGVINSTKEDSNKVNLLNELFFQYEYSDTLKASECLNKALKLSQKSGYKKGLAATHLHLAFLADDKGNAVEALKNYSAGLEVAKIMNDNKGISSFYNNIGICYQNLGNYPEALKNFLASLKVAETSNNKQIIAATTGNIGNIYYYLENFDEALNFFSLGVKLSKEINDKTGVSNAYQGIGNVYGSRGNYDEALKNFLLSLKIREEIADMRGIGGSYNNIGIIYRYRKNFEEALKNHLKALEASELTGDKAGIAETYRNIADVYFDQKKYREAREYLTKSMKQLEKIKYKEPLKEIYASFISLDSATGNYKDAFGNLKKYMLYRDSLNNDETRKKILQSQMNYDFEKKELANKLEQEKKLADFKLEAQRKSAVQNMMLIILASLLALLAAGAYFLFRNYKQKQKIREFEKNALKQKLLLSQMNPHFIFNSIDNIQGLIHNKQEEQAITYLGGFSKLTRQILENSTQNYISLTEEISMIENYLKIQQLLHNNSFNYHIHIGDAINAEAIFLPPMLTQPFIENAIKHGLNNKTGKGEITIRFTIIDTKLIAEITDNGSGFIQKHVVSGHKSMAINITRERLAGYTHKQEPYIQLDNIADANQQITGARVLIEIPYIYEN